MFKFLTKNKGQSLLEYIVLIIIIIGALLSIQVYIKRGVSGRLRSATDDIGDQFSPGNMNYLQTTKTKSVTKDTFAKGKTNSVLIGDDSTDITMNEGVLNTEQEFWGKTP